MKLSYAIKFVGDMDQAVAFYRDVLGLPLAFQSPDWSEFSTGDTRLALHSASAANPPGSVQLGFRSEDLDAFYAAREVNGMTFTAPPVDLHGSRISRALDCEGAEISVGG